MKMLPVLQALALQRLLMVGKDSAPAQKRIGKRKKRKAKGKNKTGYWRKVKHIPAPDARAVAEVNYSHGSLNSFDGKPVLNDDGQQVGYVVSAIGAGKTHQMDIEVAKANLQRKRVMNERGEAVFVGGSHA